MDEVRPNLIREYATPLFNYGDTVTCAIRGEVEIVGVSQAPIPWPIGRVPPRGRQRFLILYGDLAEAVRVEAASAVRFFWGVGWDTVWKWRQALNVAPVTEGTSRLKSENARGVAGDVARQALLEKMSDPEQDRERREKIAAAKRGKPLSRKDGAVPHAPFKGYKHTEDARRKMSATRKAKGLRPPQGKVWTAEEDQLVRTLPVAEVVQRTGRTLTSVYARRAVLRVPDGRCKISPE